jgi:hypothetical protein
LFYFIFIKPIKEGVNSLIRIYALLLASTFYIIGEFYFIFVYKGRRKENKTEQCYNIIMNDNKTIFAAVTSWITPAEAKAIRAQYLTQGLDKKQVKLSSYRWVDIKDHSKGYLCRVLMVKGLRPELEVADTKAAKKAAASNLASFITPCNTGNSATDSVAMSYYCRRNKVDDTVTA